MTPGKQLIGAYMSRDDVAHVDHLARQLRLSRSDLVRLAVARYLSESTAGAQALLEDPSPSHTLAELAQSASD